MSEDNEKVKRGQVNGIDSIEIWGAFDFAGGRFDELMVEIIDEGKRSLVLDLSHTSYLTSTGIGSMVKLVKRFKAINGELYVTGAIPDMLDVIGLAGFASFFKVLD